jgi:N-acetylmuramic acid 6-phosphate etherase
MSEKAHSRADEMSSLATLQLLEIMQAEDRSAVEAVHGTLAKIANAVDAIADRLRFGGRLHYFGAGTSGRLAELDAAECPATFGIPGDLVQAHNAGDGEAEDDADEGRREAQRSGLSSRDAVIGISAGGRTAYVLGALAEARRARSLIVGLSCAPGSPLGAAADISIEIETGAEVIAGSTRLKAGTVQKVTLNMISTGVFTRLGHTNRGRMVGVLGVNEKQRDRATRLVGELTGASTERVAQVLSAAGGSAKVAILMLRCGIAVAEARSRLAAADGDLAAALGEATAR